MKGKRNENSKINASFTPNKLLDLDIDFNSSTLNKHDISTNNKTRNNMLFSNLNSENEEEYSDIRRTLNKKHSK